MSWTRPLFQAADFLTEPWYPGNWYNSQSGSWNNPQQAYSSYLNAIGAGADQLGGAVRGGIGDAFRSGGSMLSSLRDRFRTQAPRINAIRQDQAEARRQAEEDAYYRNWDQSEQTRGGTGLDARRNRLGMGQLGSQGFANQMYYENAMRNRGGALMER